MGSAGWGRGAALAPQEQRGSGRAVLSLREGKAKPWPAAWTNLTCTRVRKVYGAGRLDLSASLLLSSEELFSINYGCIFFFPEVSWLCGVSEV